MLFILLNFCHAITKDPILTKRYSWQTLCGASRAQHLFVAKGTVETI